MLSAEVAAENQPQFQKTVKSSILQVLYFSLPAAVIILILRLPVVRLAFGARNFPWAATLLTSKTVAFLALAIPTLSVNAVLTRAFYALHNTKTPLIIAAIGAAFTAFLSIIFSNTIGLGVIGLGIALAVSNLFQMLLLLFSLHQKTPIITLKMLYSFIKIISATIATGVFLWAPMRFIDRFILDTTRTINLLILTITVLAIGMFVYLNLSAVLKIKQLSEVISLGRRIGNWKETLKSSEEMLETTSLEKPAG